MYGFCRLGVRPEPSTGAADRANGLATKVSTNAKKVATPPSTGTVQGMSWRMRFRLSATATDPSAVRTSSQRSREPSWPPQKAVDEDGNGSLRLDGGGPDGNADRPVWTRASDSNTATTEGA